MMPCIYHRLDFQCLCDIEWFGEGSTLGFTLAYFMHLSGCSIWFHVDHQQGFRGKTQQSCLFQL